MSVSWVREAVRDMAFGYRVLRSRPSVFIGVVLVLGLTVGAMISLTVLADRVLLQHLSVAAADRLAQVVRPAAGGGFPQEYFPASFIAPMRDRVKDFGAALVVGYPEDEFVSLSSRFQPEAMRVASVDGDMFATLGIRPDLGRVLDQADGSPAAEPVAVLSYECWRRRFHNSPGVIGLTLRRRNQTARIVGVLQRGFSELDVGTAPDVWLPIPKDRGGRVLVRLGQKSSALQLESALQPVFEDYLKNESAKQAGQGNGRYLARRLSVVSAAAGMSYSGVRKSFGTPLVTLAVASLLLMIIGCGNAGLLLLALQLSRRSEIAIRISLGASPSRLARQVLAETSLLAVMGCVLGCWVARPFTGALVQLASHPDRPIRIVWQSEWRTAALAGIVCVVVTGLCALMPVLRVSADGPIQAKRGVSSVIAGQMALSLVLLVGAGLLQLTWRNLDRLNPGFDKLGVLIAELQWEREGNREYTNSVYRNLLQRIARLPGVSLVSLSGWSYFGDNSRRASIVPEGATADADQYPLCEFLSVGPDFFRTMGTPLARGREFTSLDTERSRLVAVLNESAMRMYFGGAEGIGRRFSIFDPTQKIEIVGVAADTKLNSLRDPAPPMIYLPFLQSEFRGTSDTPASLEIRSIAGGHISIDELRRAVGATAPGLACRRVRSQDALLSRAVIQERLLSRVSGALGLLALAVAAAGLAGSVAQSVASRTREFGIRIALGARHRHLAADVVRRSMGPILWGIAIGLPVSLGSSRLLQGVLFGVEPSDPLIIGGGVLVLAGVAAMAAWLPSLRTTRIDPAAAIRHD